jgi:hypothetical protein
MKVSKNSSKARNNIANTRNKNTEAKSNSMKVRCSVKVRSSAKKKKTKNTTTKQAMTQITKINKKRMRPNCELEPFYRRATLFIKFE